MVRIGLIPTVLLLALTAHFIGWSWLAKTALAFATGALLLIFGLVFMILMMIVIGGVVRGLFPP